MVEGTEASPLMFGQGSPHRRGTAFRGSRLIAGPVRALAGIALLVLFAWSPVAADDRPSISTVRLRIVWGGGPARTWEGTIRCPDGPLADLALLGLEPDEARTLRLVGPELVIRSQGGALTVDTTDAGEIVILLDLPAPS